MAGKPATISDLFAPMQSIEACMNSQGSAINNNLVSINNAVLNCATTLSDGSKFLKNTTKDLKKTIDGSLKSLTDAAQKQVMSGVSASASMNSAVSGSINAGFMNLNATVSGISQQIDILYKYIRTKQGRYRKGVKKINVPDISGGKNAGNLAKSLAEAAHAIGKISYRESLMIKKKASKIIGGLLDIFEDKKKQMQPAAMKKNEASVKSLTEISDALFTVTKKMAAVLPLAPFAILGAKLSSKVIKNILKAIRPLDDVKSLKKTVTATKNLELIATSMLKFNAAMALNLILAVPAMAGAAATFIVLGGSLFLFNLLGKRTVSRNLRQAAINLNLMSLGIVTFTLSLLASTMIMKYLLFGTDNKFNPTNIKALGSSILVYGVMIGTFALYSMIGSGKATKDVWFGAAAIGVMSSGLILFSLSLLTSYMITKAIIGNVMSDGKIDGTDILSLISAVPVFLLMYGAMKLYGRIGSDENTRRVVNGGLAVVVMSLGFMAFGAAFYVVHQITRSIVGDWRGGKDIGALVMDVGVLALMLGSLWLYRKIGAPENTRRVVNGGLSILMLSAGFVVFSAALYISHMITKDIWKSENGKMDWYEALKTVSIFGLMYSSMLIFKAIGKSSKDIMLGAVASLAMSVGIAAFGYGLAFLTNPIKNNTAADLWLGPGLIAAFAVEFGIMGLGPVPASIAFGAAASLAMSGGISVFGFSLKSMMDSVKGTDVKTIKSYIGIIKDFALNFAAIGIPVVAPFITLGAAALTAAGGAVLVLGKALREWNSVDIDETKLDLLCKSVDRIKLAFQGNPKGEHGTRGILKGLSNAVFAPFDMVAITASAGAIAVSAAAIRELAEGLSSWNSMNIKEEDTLSIIKTIGSIYGVFGQIGTKNEKSGNSFLKTVIGIDFSGFASNDIENGIRSTEMMGHALNSVSKGLIEFYNGIGSYFKDPAFMEQFTAAVANVIGGLSAVFSKIGKEQVTITNGRVKSKVLWMGDVFDEITKTSVRMKSKNAVNEGIKAVKDLGKTIKDIAAGLKEFKEIVPSGSTSFIISVASGISALLEGLTGPLIAFGTTEESFSAAAVKASSASAKYGEALSGVQSIAAQTTNYEHHKVDVSNAMKNISQIGELVKGLAEGAKIMADPRLAKDIGKAGTITGDFIVGDDGSGVVGNIQKLVCSNLAVFLQLGKKIEELGIYEAFHDEVVQDIRRGGKVVTNKSVRVSEGKKSYIAMAVDAAVGIGQVISNLAEGYKLMNDNFPTDKKMTEGTARVTKSISTIMTAFSTIGLAMNFDPNTIHQLIPAAFGDPEMSKMFGNVSGLSPLLKKNSSENFNEISENIRTIVDTVINGISGISGSMKNIEDFYKKSNIVMESGINLTVLGMMFANHADEYKLTAYHNGKDKTYTLSKLYKSWLENSKENVGLIKNTSEILSEAVPNLSKLTPVAGNAFVNFSNQMTKGMNTLSGTNTNIINATNFIEKLRISVKEDVFGNISSNTQKIASAINSIDNDIFEPYAKMIGALGIMTDKHGEFIKMQRELYELLEKIIEKINESNSSSSSSSEYTQQNTSSNQQVSQKPQPQERPQQMTARLTPTKVTLDSGTFIRDFEEMLNRIKTER